MKEKLIVDGKNVLKPVDLAKNKKEIMAARENVPSQISLTHFNEKVLVFSANVKGEEANKLVTELQGCVSDINQREAVIFDNIDTLYKTVESIHKGSIEGIIVAIKSAQTAIEQAEYAIGTIKETLKILQDFKTRLEDSSAHLEEIDTLWDKTEGISKTVGKLEKDLKGKLKENSNKISDLQSFKKRLEKCKHIDDIDKIFDECQTLKSRVTTLEDNNKSFEDTVKGELSKQKQTIDGYDDRLTELENYKSRIESVEHISDVDDLWEQTYNLNAFAANMAKIQHLEDVDAGWEQLENQKQTLTDICCGLEELSNSQKDELADLRNRIKYQYYAIAGLFLALIIVVICNLLGVL